MALAALPCVGGLTGDVPVLPLLVVVAEEEVNLRLESDGEDDGVRRFFGAAADLEASAAAAEVVSPLKAFTFGPALLVDVERGSTGTSAVVEEDNEGVDSSGGRPPLGLGAWKPLVTAKVRRMAV
jgi:hypothetical protein